MKKFLKKNSVIYIGIFLVIGFLFAQPSHVFAEALCLTNPWGPDGADNRCDVTASISVATNPVTSGGNTNITITGSTLYQWSDGGFGTYSAYLTDAAGTVIDSWAFDGGYEIPVAGGPVTFNSGALTGPVTVNFCATSIQMVTACNSAYITVTAPSSCPAVVTSITPADTGNACTYYCNVEKTAVGGTASCPVSAPAEYSGSLPWTCSSAGWVPNLAGMTCVAPLPASTNGACNSNCGLWGTASNCQVWSSYPTSNSSLCTSPGTADSANTTATDYWAWRCPGTNSGTDATGCSAWKPSGTWTAPTCPSACGTGASTPAYTCVGGNGYCSTNSPATRSCSATTPCTCTAPLTQNVTVACDANSSGYSAISGAVTRSQTKSAYPACTFPATPVTSSNSTYITDNCVYPTGTWTAPTCPSACGTGASTPAYTCVGGNGYCSTNSPATRSCSATATCATSGAWTAAPSCPASCGLGSSTQYGTCGYDSCTGTQPTRACSATAACATSGLYSAAPACPTACGTAASTQYGTCGYDSCTNSQPTRACSATAACTCTAPLTQNVTVACDANSSGFAATSGSVTRSQTKSAYPTCTFPATPITSSNSTYVSDTCVYPTPTCANGGLSGPTSCPTCANGGIPASTCNPTCANGGAACTCNALPSGGANWNTTVPSSSAWVSRVYHATDPGSSVACTYYCDSTHIWDGGTCALKPTDCYLDGTTIISGYQITAYNSRSATSPATCASLIRYCTNGYLDGDITYQYANCTNLVPTINSFTVTPTRVRSGGAVTIKWSTTDVTSCSVKKNGVARWSGTSSSGTPDTVTTQTTYTITCDSLPSKSVTVNVVPSYEEF